MLARSEVATAHDILREGLQSPNAIVVGYSVQGLARLRDEKAIPEIRKAAERFFSDGQTVIGMNLPWFVSIEADVLMKQLVPNQHSREMFIRQVQAEQVLDRQNAARRTSR